MGVNTRKFCNRARIENREENWANNRRSYNEYKNKIKKEKWETIIDFFNSKRAQANSEGYSQRNNKEIELLVDGVKHGNPGPSIGHIPH